jgi:hypothetical protein
MDWVSGTGDRLTDRVRAEVTYLDLDGDGVLDAVRTVDVSVLHLASEDVVRVLEELDAGIGDDGVPTALRWTERLIEAGR